MVVDAVLANDEWDLFLFRCRYLSPKVDKFYVGESAVTFSGLKKGLFFSDRLDELRALDKPVQVIKIEIPERLLHGVQRWAIETYARDSFLEQVAELHPNDVILFSDLDEIPSVDQVAMLSSPGFDLRIVSIPTQVCLRMANWVEYQPDEWQGKWGNGLIGKFWTPRIRRGQYPLAPGQPGVHLSYVGMDAPDVRQKYRAFSHGELDRDDTASVELLRFADFFHISHLGRAFDRGAGLLTVVQQDDFCDVQAKAFELHPEWFGLMPVHQSKVRRLVASWLLFRKMKGTLREPLEDANASYYSWAWLRHALSYGFVWVAWKSANRLGILKVIRWNSRKRT